MHRTKRDFDICVCSAISGSNVRAIISPEHNGKKIPINIPSGLVNIAQSESESSSEGTKSTGCERGKRKFDRERFFLVPFISRNIERRGVVFIPRDVWTVKILTGRFPRFLVHWFRGTGIVGFMGKVRRLQRR